jgi:hypothetical protein
MRLVAALAFAMPGGRTRVLVLVTASAGRRHGSAVRLVATGAFLVACVRFRVLARVTALAALTGDLEQRTMRETAMAALAALVALQRGDVRELVLVTALTARVIGERTHEIVRRMAGPTRRAPVEVLVGSGRLVTGAAVPHARLHTGLRAGMRIVTAHTSARSALDRVVGMLVRVTLRAGLFGRAFHVVR